MHNESPEVTIKKGSKTFSLAALFFPKKEWDAALRIYQWCRYCDDEIDNGGTSKNLLTLQSETEEILLEKREPQSAPFKSLKQTVSLYNIPHFYPLELLMGMKMDIEGKTYNTLNELELYCYRVAGTVGLMMCYIMGIFSISALQNAAHLGIAMQLTNIARDVKEDFLNGRIYLPGEWLKESNIKSDELFSDTNSLYLVVLKLLDKADEFYKSGLKGTIELPLRSAFVITIAALTYQAIGNKIRRAGTIALETRTVVSLFHKILIIVWALIITASSIPGRILRNKKLVVIDRLWRIA